MSEPRDDRGLSSSVLQDYREKGLAGRVGFGRRPAVLVVDFITGFTDPQSPLGSVLDDEVQATAQLLELARSLGLPIFLTTTVYEPSMVDAGLFVRKVPALAELQAGSEWVRVDPRLGRQPSEPILEKRYASAFFATHLAATLVSARCDTVIVCGCTTSGCVRATVVDALQHGFRAIVPRQCVGDRAPAQHEANLIDIDGKYGDVEELQTVQENLRLLATGGGS